MGFCDGEEEALDGGGGKAIGWAGRSGREEGEMERGAGIPSLKSIVDVNRGGEATKGGQRKKRERKEKEKIKRTAQPPRQTERVAQNTHSLSTKHQTPKKLSSKHFLTSETELDKHRFGKKKLDRKHPVFDIPETIQNT